MGEEQERIDGAQKAFVPSGIGDSDDEKGDGEFAKNQCADNEGLRQPVEFGCQNRIIESMRHRGQVQRGAYHRTYLLLVSELA